MKFDPVRVAWIIRQKEKGLLTSRTFAEKMGVSQIWVKKLWRRYRVAGKVPELGRPGRRNGRGLSELDRETVVRGLC